MSAELCWTPARELARRIRDKELSSVEVVTAHLERIAAFDGRIGAIVELDADGALAAAARADAAAAPLGPLHGLPVAVKDLMDVAGLHTTHGCPAFADNVAERDSLLAERLRAAGAIILGKTNTPEFGAGAVTFNPLFGPTRNPYDLTRNAGGSSGGAAAALAAGFVALADGSDSGGSVRVPASFCNVVGLRPAPGRIPSTRLGNGWSPHGTLGPMARTVADAGLLLAALAGRDDRWPIALDEDPAPYAAIEPRDLRGVRVAWSRDLDGLPVEPEVTEALETARGVLTGAGAVVEDVEPDLAGADEAWETIELFEFAASVGAIADEHGDRVRPDVVENVRLGRAIPAERLAHAYALRTELYRRTVALLERYDLLATPAVQVAPLPAEAEYAAEVAGVPSRRYYDWQRASTRVTVTGHPALALPGAFSDGGLPIGLQLVGRHRDELTLLRHGAAFEAAAGLAGRRPAL
ncbi:MAG TPA: amidase family protein [Solirubrobacteraceae bacterium]|nr:amidase family protein [Solirubrobacteraceae bacterium]